MPLPPAAAAHKVNSVNSVTVSPALDDAASDAAFEATERAAIIAESVHGNAAAAVPHPLPPAWFDLAVLPTAGGSCADCGGRKWWGLQIAGWRCARCFTAPALRVGSCESVET